MIALRRTPSGLGTTAQDIANAIFRQEGPVQNNNPGNLLYAGQPGATGKDSRGFAIFDTLASGQTAEVNQINLDVSRGTCATGASVITLPDLITCLSPPGQNDTATYITNVSNWTGVDPNTPLAALFAASGTYQSDSAVDPTDIETAGVPADFSTLALFAVGGLVLWFAFSRG